jgi:ribosomal protein S18 acetylase RimI-like enzyme
MEIHQAGPDDWSSVRDVRLRALRDAPDAFGSTFVNEAENDEDRWRSWMTGWEGAVDQVLFASIESGAWVGIALGVRWGGEADATHLYAMWVDPARRRRGAGRALVDAVVDWARALPDVRRIVLAATVSNPAAIALYDRCGFADTGERTPLRDGSEIPTMLMARSV